jgi:hypothetical protein
MNTHTLVQHSDIQKWVSSRKGQPAISRIRDRTGMIKSRLTLSFALHQAKPTETPSQDDGMSPVSWAAWLAELDRQNLALRVSGEKQPNYEFVKRRELN